MTNIKQIREAVIKNRGGYDNATDEQIMIVWNMFSPALQKEYLDSVKAKGKTDANPI